MKYNILILFIGCCTYAQAQTLKELEPFHIKLLDLSQTGEKTFLEARLQAEEISKKPANELTEEQHKSLAILDESNEGYWDIIGNACSWYCGGTVQSVVSSTALTAQGKNTYIGNNAHDLSYKSAWVEGVPGDGVGQFLLYTFAGNCPRITKFIVVNGYVKSERAYQENGRVKKLKVYYNEEPFAILNLTDLRSCQSFEIDPIGNGDRENIEKLKSTPDWTLKFEILETYKGRKYDDVAITEIYFDGIDVH